MIVYHATKEHFLEDVYSGHVDDELEALFLTKVGKFVGQSERQSWKASVRKMRDVLKDVQIPNDITVSIEFMIPQTAKRLDFVLAGQTSAKQDCAIIIEMKQWEKVEKTDKDGIIFAKFYNREESHPSYQAWSYAALLTGFNEVIYSENINLKPCAYLHNYIPDDVIKNDFYKDYTEKAPVFLEGDDEKEKLQSFIKRYLAFGDKTNLMYRIEESRIRPSKSLADSLSKMLKGNSDFVMIDEQKVVYENAFAMSQAASEEKKKVYIVEGGPGTGKSVIAINLLVNTIKKGLVAKYVTKNAAPRAVYESMLTGTLKKTEYSHIFSGSGSFYELEQNSLDVLIVDEAHRLTKKSGMFQNKGENQILEIIKSAKCSIFFIDEDQKVTWKDIGQKEEIEMWAKELGAEIKYGKLESQFRCGGSDGYIAWLDNTLQIKETANKTLIGIPYEFKVVKTPSELRDIIFEKNKINNKARLVAGYCWDWISKKHPNTYDIEFPEYDFRMKWNLLSDGSKWVIAPESVTEIGCIHTIQGLDADYVGVIIGDDLIVREGKVICRPEKRAKTDQSLKGYKKDLKEDERDAMLKAEAIIKNTYRTLMSRGMKGCYIYCVDQETQEYFTSLMSKVF